MTPARVLVVAEARTWLRTPWHHRARVRGAGVDCGQLLAAVYEAAGVLPHVESGTYPRDFMCHRDEERMISLVLDHAREVAAPGPGDIAIWRFGRVYSHAAIVTDWPRIIHAYAQVGEVVEDNATTNQRLASRPVRFFSPWGEA
jgi:cell wall-associated NlpC family hydrolase